MLEMVAELLGWAERGFRDTANPTGLGAVESIRAVLLAQQGAFAHAFALGRSALDRLPEQDRVWRGHDLTLLGVEALCRGDLVQASQLLRSGLVCYDAAGSLPGMLFATVMLGEVTLSQGELHGAAQLFHRVLAFSGERHDLYQNQLTLEQGQSEEYYEHLARYGLAQLAYDWNRIEEAEQLLQQAQAPAPQVWLPLLTAGLMLHVRLLIATGRILQARDFLHEQAARNPRPEVLREIACCQAFLALSQGDLTSAEHWARNRPTDLSLSLSRQEEELLLLARLRIAQGQPHVALDLLEGIKSETRKRSSLQILLLEAVALDACRDRDRAQARLMQAGLLARPEGYQRLFLDEGAPIKALLKILLHNQKAGDLATYFRTLLQAAASRENGPSAQVPASSWLIEPLTPQERRVLHLLTEGASNQEIAEHLTVSLTTAKKHVANILAKLGVQNRAQAGALARDYGLL
jgi:LuxR family maltose regulon positive regulatory protein